MHCKLWKINKNIKKNYYCIKPRYLNFFTGFIFRTFDFGKIRGNDTLVHVYLFYEFKLYYLYIHVLILDEITHFT